MLDISLLPLDDGRVRLRPLRPADAPGYVEGTEDADVRAYAHLPEDRYTTELVIEMIDGTIQDGLDRGDLAVLAIADPDDAFVGSLVVFDVTPARAEVGFWMRSAARGKGLATAALDLAVTFVRDSGIPTVTARTVPGNHASRKVLERASFRELETTPSTTPSGEHVSTVHLEWVPPRATVG